ncbi:MAG: SpoIIE family protein phosphatase [Synergistaceae bacterium]|nr:SpoIIE family protein phosphatase [Synergistaceae bacterium]MBQ6418131.1 SpoIIE family protein phosphatase [Synergistaceae bacterium]MBR0248151.1 SpoIIE family protein phosphatase [Synergistaceae bacterium]
MKRSTIRKKLQAVVLYISVIALIITGAVGIAGMRRIQNDSEQALIRQMEQNLANITDSKADLAESELGKFVGYAQNFADYIHGLYTASQDYLPHMVMPARIENTGTLAMQRIMDRSADIESEALKSEISLLGNLRQIWDPVSRANSNVITSVYAGTKSGAMIAYDKNSFNSLPEGNDSESYYSFHNSDWYKLGQERGSAFFTDVYYDNFGMGLMITCGAPFYDAEGNFAGVVCMDILISDLYKAIVDVDLGDEAHAFLVDRAGKIINPPDKGNSAGQTIHDVTKSLADEIMSGKTGVSLSDSRIYYAYTPIESTGWKFCVRIPESVILAPVRSVNERVIYTMLSFLGAFVIIVVLAVFAARKFSGKLTDPIVALEHDVKEISGGNLDYRAEIRTNDEIGDLAKSFNDMAASLKDYVKNLAAVTAEKERIGAELNIATQIQADMLPRIFPPFPDRNEFDIYASMNPAKEVGGDFYDFFMVDDDHLALVMADVSGKGVPAALFMVISKTLIKNRTQMGGTPSEILADVNEQLCEGNEAELFVTVWLGILEISTGHVTASNAGHEYPAIYRPGEGYTLFKTKQSPAVATMEGLKFRSSEFTLNPGDSLYIYTDGVAEATNINNELYGTDRMIETLNQTVNMPVDEVLAVMKKSVDDFTGDAPQFDDITMLSLRYNGKC